MVVQHNLRAMNSNRMLGLTASVQSKSTEKLSSGYKINRAADDAAGLSISEKMRKQIRGLSQASLNAADGISAVQTAEGALNEVQDMLQRMNELAVKAANGTMSEDDRGYIQDEIDQLVTEIDRVAETTKFNETYLLKGDENSVTTKTITTRAATFEMKYAAAVESTLEWAGDDADTVYANKDGVSAELTEDNIEDYFEVKDDGTIAIKDGVKFYADDADEGTNFGAQLTAKDITISDYVKVGSTALLDENEKVVDEAALSQYFDETGAYKGGLFKYDPDNDDAKTEVGAEQIDDYVTWNRKAAETVEASINGALTFSLQVGAETNTDNKITIDIKAMSADGLGITGLKVDGKDSKAADAAVKVIADAIQMVSEQRSALGAVQNRLEHTIANLDNVVENTTAAESQIRDTDMATEMVKYSNNNILAQAGQAMLAQANQANQGVLSLLG